MEKLNQEIEDELTAAAEAALSHPQPLSDPWLKHLDWSGLNVFPLTFTCCLVPKDSNRKIKSAKTIALSGRPQWYRDLWSASLGRVRITPRQKATPYLLKLTWCGQPLYHSKNYGWTFPLVDSSQPSMGMQSSI